MKKKKRKFTDTEKRIQNARKEKGILQVDLVVFLDTTTQTVSNMENGRTTYTEETARKIADFLQVDYRYLTYDIDYKDFNDMLDKQADTHLLRSVALDNLLKSYGYLYGGVVSSQNHAINQIIKEHGIKALYKADNDAIVEIAPPDKKPRYILQKDLEQLINDFFAVLDNRLKSDIDL